MNDYNSIINPKKLKYHHTSNHLNNKNILGVKNNNIPFNDENNSYDNISKKKTETEKNKKTIEQLVNNIDLESIINNLNNNIFKKKLYFESSSLKSRIISFNNKTYFNFINKYIFCDFNFKINEKIIINDNILKIIKPMFKICALITKLFVNYLNTRIMFEIKKKQFIDTNMDKFIDKYNKVTIHEFGHNCTHGCIKNNDFPSKKCLNLCYYKVKNTQEFKTIDIIEEILISSLAYQINLFIDAKNKSLRRRKINNVKFEKILIILKNNPEHLNLFINNLIYIFSELNKNREKIYINSRLFKSFQFNNSRKEINSQCDLIIDDILFLFITEEIKYKNFKHLLQLLGHTALLRKYNKYKIKTMNIINFFDGKITTYDMNGVSKTMLYSFYKLLNKDIDLKLSKKKYQFKSEFNYNSDNDCDSCSDYDSCNNYDNDFFPLSSILYGSYSCFKQNNKILDKFLDK